MARNYAAMPHEYLQEMQKLTDEEFGRLMRGLLVFSMTGEMPELPGKESLFEYRVILREMGLQQSYEELSQIRREAGKKGAEARWHGKMADDD